LNTDTISLAVVDIAQWATFNEKHTLMVDALSAELDESAAFFSRVTAARNAALEMMPGTSDRTGACSPTDHLPRMLHLSPQPYGSRGFLVDGLSERSSKFGISRLTHAVYCAANHSPRS
jgi:hypothetical protein